MNFLASHNFINVDNCAKGSEFYLIAQLAKKSDQPLLYIAADEQQASNIYRSCQYYLTDKEVLYFPAWDILPYDLNSPSPKILNKRMQTLFSLAPNASQKIIITSVAAIIQKIPEKSELLASALHLRVGESFDREELLNYLVEHNYVRGATADMHGEFAVRGSIIDIVVDVDQAYRIDFFGSQIDSIKLYDLETQLSIVKLNEVAIIPPSELILSKENVARFTSNLLAKYGEAASNTEIMQNMQRGKYRFIGVESWLPLFYRNITDLFSYINHTFYTLMDSYTASILTARSAYIEELYLARLKEVEFDRKSIIKPLLPSELYVDYWNDFKLTEQISNIVPQTKKLVNLYQQSGVENCSVFILLAKLVQDAKNKVIISCISKGSSERVQRILADHEIDITILEQFGSQNFADITRPVLIISPIEHGFICDEFTLVTESELFGEKINNLGRKKQKSFKQLVEQANNFEIGEIVVHVDYGIGRFEGLEVVELQNTKHDCLKVVYDGGDILYIPVEDIELLSKYDIEGEVTLDKLGHTSWQARKSKMRNRIKVSAQYLLNIAAVRLGKACEHIAVTSGLYDEFCANFPYVETDDQLAAIEAITEDLASGKPMDRLICGDVGFGKTEVAIRAAFMVLKANDHVKRQVAVICPTTLLCKQHYKSFSSRFQGFDINVRQLSRFVSAKEISETIKGINDGSVDIVVCTHALLNQKIKFKNLALLIIDEEQHFGVIQKEKLKEKQADVHVLSLSATPIPRTLQMSLTGIKDLSIIATPPIDRMLTKTTVMVFDSVMVKEALLREFYAGGQSFYVCPRISDLDDVLSIVTSLTPELKVVVAHGQLSASNLEKLMQDFYSHKYDILISTSIIESGLDLASANTIIIHRADKFGLSQLYQLRGRVGRGKRKSYAYFTLPNKEISPVVAKRLEILQNIDSLGAGFAVASHDMDVRGFGNLLGDEQSGHIEEVGIELYQEMLQQTLQSLRATNNDEAIEERWIPQINLGLSILIPESYIADTDLRLSLYQRISNLESENEIESFAAEMIDRFGPLPKEFNHLISTIKLKRLCVLEHIKKIDAGPKAIMLEFCGKNFAKSEKIMSIAASQPSRIKLRPDNKILLAYGIEDADKRVAVVEKFILSLGKK